MRYHEQPRPTYRVTREFINGLLEGRTYTETTRVPRRVGQVVEVPSCGGSGYKIIECIELPEEA